MYLRNKNILIYNDGLLNVIYMQCKNMMNPTNIRTPNKYSLVVNRVLVNFLFSVCNSLIFVFNLSFFLSYTGKEVNLSLLYCTWLYSF